MRDGPVTAKTLPIALLAVLCGACDDGSAPERAAIDGGSDAATADAGGETDSGTRTDPTPDGGATDAGNDAGDAAAPPPDPCDPDPCTGRPGRVCDAETGTCVCAKGCSTPGDVCVGGVLSGCQLREGCLVPTDSRPCIGGVCADTGQCGFTLGGRVLGLAQLAEFDVPLTLTTEAGDSLSLAADGPFTFERALLDGAAYRVRIDTQPAGHQCSVRNAVDRVPTANVSNVGVQCSAFTSAPLSRTDYIKPSRTQRNAHFGAGVAISADGRTLVVGVPGDNSSGRGVDPPQDDNDTVDSGAVFIYVRDDAGWSQQAFIKAPAPGYGFEFGHAVALRGDLLAVGAPGETYPFDAGAVHVYVRQGRTWRHQARLSSPQPDAADRFGESVALSGVGGWMSAEDGDDTLAVGAPREDSSMAGTPSDNSTPDAGAVHVFTRDGARWRVQGFLKAGNAGVDDRFGTAVDADGDSIVVGAPGEDALAPGGLDDDAPDSGAVYLFARTAGTWGPVSVLSPPAVQAGDALGSAVALCGGLLAAGAPGDGAVHVFSGQSDDLRHTARIAPAGGAGAAFGAALALRGNTLAVGAPDDALQAVGIDPVAGDPTAPRSGAAFIFDRTVPGSWTLRHLLKATNTGTGDLFGRGVDVGNDAVAVGAPFEDSAGTTIDGPDGDQPIDLSAYDGGATYVFR